MKLKNNFISDCQSRIGISLQTRRSWQLVKETYGTRSVYGSGMTISTGAKETTTIRWENSEATANENGIGNR